MNILIMGLLAGVLGMGIGALLTLILGTRTEKMISIFLAFAGGVMMSIALIELIPEAIEYGGMIIAAVGLAAGIVMVLAFHSLIDMLSSKGKKREKLHGNYTEYLHASDINKKSMLRSGIVMLFAIALHNIPEGLAMGAAGHHDVALGISLAILIGLHNVPEGMAVSAPLISGGLTKGKVLCLTLLAGATTAIGTAFGIFFGGISDVTLALSFAIAGGAMLYVVLGEILPQVIVIRKDRTPILFLFLGIVLGMLFTAI